MGASSSSTSTDSHRCVILDRQFVLMYVYLDQGIRKVAVLPRVCPLYEKVQGMAIGGPSSLGAAVKASDQRYLAVAFEHEENLVEVAQDGAVLSPFALAQLSQSLTPVYVHDVTPWATARDHELARDATTKGGDVPSSGAPSEDWATRRTFPEAGILKMHL